MRSWSLFLAVLAGTIICGQPPESKEPYKVGGSVSPPRVVYKVEPEYTQEALNARREGSVLIELVVTRDGMPSEPHELGQKLGLGLAEKAIEAVQQWRFEPGQKSGQPVAVIVDIRINFQPPR
jgi:periplasmic protein TonB